MIVRELDPTERELLVRAAILAPSMHESRPWRFGFRGDTVEVYRDCTEQPGAFSCDDEPQARWALVGIGAALFNLRVAAAALARGTTTTLFPDPSRPALVAQVRIWPGPGAEVGLAGLLVHLYRPRPNFGPYADRPIPSAIRKELEQAANAEGATLRWGNASHWEGFGDDGRDGSERDRGDGRDGGGSDGGGSDGGGSDGGGSDGVPARLVRWLGAPPPTATLAYDHVEQASGLADFDASWTPAFLTTANACPRGWLTAGQALQRVLLVAARHGLSGSPLDEPLSWPSPIGRPLPHNPRPDGRPAQLLLGLGWGGRVARTPRRPLADFMADGA